MNEPIDESNAHEFENEIVDSLKKLKPRACRIDWDAIRSAQGAADVQIPAVQRTPRALPARWQRAGAWWSGLAVGVAITFLSMHWIVLRELRTKIERLEQAAIATAPRASGNLSANEQSLANSRSAFDVNALLDAPNFSVGSSRVRADRLVSTLSIPKRSEPASAAGFDDSLGPESGNTAGDQDPQADRRDPAVSPLQLLRELQHEFY